MRSTAFVAFVLSATGLMTSGCRDTSRFATNGDRYEGSVVKGSFVRSGVGEDVKLCLTLDTDRLKEAPGTITTSDGRFRAAALRPIPQVWHDPLSTLDFGDGRIQNLLYAVSPTPSEDGGFGEGDAQDVMAIVSLMQSEHVEVRLVRGAPQTDAGAGLGKSLFAVFNLDRQPGPCAF